MRKGFVNKLNEKFAKAARETEDAHIDLGSSVDLEQVFCWDKERKIKNDWTFQFYNTYYQIDKITATRLGLKPKQTITVRRHLDDSLSFWHGEHRLVCQAIEKIQGKQQAETEELDKSYDSLKRSTNAKLNKHKTPWSKW